MLNVICKENNGTQAHIRIQGQTFDHHTATMQNFVIIGQTIAEISQFLKIFKMLFQQALQQNLYHALRRAEWP